MKILIVDDEPPARARLKALLAELDAGPVVGEAAHGAAALDAVAATGAWSCSTSACRGWTAWRPRTTSRGWSTPRR